MAEKLLTALTLWDFQQNNVRTASPKTLSFTLFFFTRYPGLCTRLSLPLLARMLLACSTVLCWFFWPFRLFAYSPSPRRSKLAARRMHIVALRNAGKTSTGPHTATQPTRSGVQALRSPEQSNEQQP